MNTNLATLRGRLRALPLLLIAAVVLRPVPPATAQTLPTPEAFLGFPVGADNKLAGWDQILEYMHMADRASDRVRTEIRGKTTLDRDFALVIVSSAENMRNLERLTQINRRLYHDAASMSEAEARRLIDEGKVFVCITLNIHSTEIASSQMVLEAVYRLATENSPYIQSILDNVVLLLVPSLNPDGQAMVVDWHNQTFGTEYEGASMPWLYHYYTGHDNNRDAYMMSQVETRLLAKVLYYDYIPEIWLDEHQMGNRGARLFLMPAAGPPNPNVDPWIYRTAGLLGFAQALALDEAGKPGVVYGQSYTYWWQGAMAWTGWWHNMVGMLSEAASANLAAPVEGGEARDTVARPEYLNPWPGGRWTLRDIVDYELLLTFGLLDASADMRENLLSGIHAVNKRTIEKGMAGDPYAILVPADQHDDPTVVKFLDVLELGGVKIEQATAAFTADGASYPAGTYVIPMAQVFRNYVKDLIEPQVYPSEERPYDVTGWSLGMQMGVETVFVDRPFRYSGGPRQGPASQITGEGNIILLDGSYNASHTAALRLLRSGQRVSRAIGENMVGGVVLPAGTFVVEGRGAREAVQEAIGDLHMKAYAVPAAPASRRLNGAPRVALYQTWGGNMDEGWTRYVLDTFGWEPITIHPEDVRDQRRLARTYDVILFPSVNTRSVVEGLGGAGGGRGGGGRPVPPQYQGGIGETGLAALKEFVADGGTLVALGGGAGMLIEQFELPFADGREGIERGVFNCPGSILEIQVDPDNPIAWGMPQRAGIMFSNDATLTLPEGVSGVDGAAVAAWFGDEDPLLSGFIQGPEHLFGDIGAMSVKQGNGTLVLFPLQVQRRAQTHATFKLLFNSLMNSVMR